MVDFLAEHNLPIALADHIGSLVKDIFLDSKTEKNTSVLEPRLHEYFVFFLNHYI